MIELVEANWPWFLIALLIGLAVAWFIFIANRRTTVTRDSAEADSPAMRNQALIDAPPVAATDAAPTAGKSAVPAAPNKGGDDLTRIKGVGPKLAATLKALGVASLADIAAWSDADIDRIDGQLGRFEGRIRRDDWVKQAKLLESGDTQSYEGTFGKL